MKWRGSDKDWFDKQSLGAGGTSEGWQGRRREQDPETSGQPSQYQQQSPDIAVGFELRCRSF